MIADFWISPHYRLSDFPEVLDIDHKIVLFFDRIFYWQLDIADQCINERNSDNSGVTIPMIKGSGVAVLSIVLSYFEMIGKYEAGYVGDFDSRKYFEKGFISVAPHLEQQPQTSRVKFFDIIYRLARNPLYHSGLLGNRIVLTHEIEESIRFQQNPTLVLVINPHRLVPTLKVHFIGYRDRLKDTNNILLRQNFEKRFDYDAEYDIPNI